MRSVNDGRFKEIIAEGNRTTIAKQIGDQWMIEAKWIPYYNREARAHDEPPPRMLMLMNDPRHTCPITHDECRIIKAL